MTLEIGDSAPLISLPEGPGQQVDVDWSAGPTVILFFPLAFSGVCTDEFCGVRDEWWSAWSDLGVKVYGISVDSCFVSAKFRELEKIPFQMLSDFNKQVSAQWGTLLDDFFGQKGVSCRASFVIGTDGRIIHAEVQEDSGRVPRFDAVHSAIQSVIEASA